MKTPVVNTVRTNFSFVPKYREKYRYKNNSVSNNASLGLSIFELK